MMAFLLALSTLFANQAFALSCGSYQVSGFLRQDGQTTFIAVAEKSSNESKIILHPEKKASISELINFPVSAKITILRASSGDGGEANSIEGLDLRVPDPLAEAQHSPVHLLKKLPCGGR